MITLVAAAARRAILENWHVSLGALLIAGGVILFLVALRLVLQQYADARLTAPDLPLSGATIHLPFPMIVTPYGIATVKILLSISLDSFYVIGNAAVLIGVMALNLLAMLYT